MDYFSIIIDKLHAYKILDMICNIDFKEFKLTKIEKNKIQYENNKGQDVGYGLIYLNEFKERIIDYDDIEKEKISIVGNDIIFLEIDYRNTDYLKIIFREIIEYIHINSVENVFIDDCLEGRIYNIKEYLEVYNEELGKALTRV